MKKEEYAAGMQRLEAASQRTLEIYKHVGRLSTYFAGLEIVLIQLLAKLINPADTARPERSLSQLSFRQTVEAFRQTVSQILPEPGIAEEADSLADRIGKIASRRNDIIHSSWIAYTPGDFGQHRARPKGKNPRVLETHRADPIKMIDKLTEDVHALMFDLVSFEDRIDADDHQSAAPFAPEKRKR